MDNNLALRRAKIEDLEEAVKSLPNQIDMDENLTHYSCDGLYGRELWMKAGAVWVGKIHKRDCVLVMLKGRVAMINAALEDQAEIWEAPCVRISPAGTKRALYILEDTIFLTVHPNPKNLFDLKDIEDELIAKSFAEYDKLLEHKS